MNVVRRATMSRKSETYTLYMENAHNDTFSVKAYTGSRTIRRGAGLTKVAALDLFEQILVQKGYEGFDIEQVFESSVPAQFSDFTLPLATKTVLTKPAESLGTDYFHLSVPAKSQRVWVSVGVFNPSSIDIYDDNRQQIDKRPLNNRNMEVSPFIGEAYIKDGNYYLVDLFWYGDHELRKAQYIQRRQLISDIVKKVKGLTFTLPSVSQPEDKGFALSIPADRDVSHAIRYYQGIVFPAIVSAISMDSTATLALFESNSIKTFSSAHLPEAFNVICNDIVSVGYCHESNSFIILKPDTLSRYEQCVKRPMLTKLLRNRSKAVKNKPTFMLANDDSRVESPTSQEIDW